MGIEVRNNLGRRILAPKWQRWICAVASANLGFYVFSVFYWAFGDLGIRWTRILNQLPFFDYVIIWLSICALFFLLYTIYVIARRGVSLVCAITLLWSVVWIAELLWLHQFIVYK
jgi:hypothetical protein